MNLDRLYSLVAALTLAVIAVLLATLWTESGQPWQWYQKEFAARTAADRPARLEAAATPQDRSRLLDALELADGRRPALREIAVTKLGEVSRCVTCHVAVTEPLAARAEFPFNKHPESYLDPRWHPVERYGCLICHGGEGRATDADAAHGLEVCGATPRRSGEYVQAACSRCHRERPIEAAPAWNLGRALVAESGCSGCHDLGPDLPGVHTGPPLAGLGSKTTTAWLTVWLRDPAAVRPDTRMPRTPMAADEIKSLVALLFSSRDPQIDAQNGEYASLPVDLARRGRTLAQQDLACADCHDIPDLQRAGEYAIPGRRLALNLAGTGDKLTPAWIAALLDDPTRRLPTADMPRYGLAGDDRRALVAFLAGLRSSLKLPPPGRQTDTPAGPAASDAELRKGSDVLANKGCPSCHATGDLSPELRFGPSLAAVGDRQSWELDWGSAAVTPGDRHLITYLLRKLERPRQFHDDLGAANPLRMPTFRFSGPQRRAVATYLLSRTAAPIPQEYVVTRPTDNVPRSACPTVFFSNAIDSIPGRLAPIVARYHCTACHAIAGQGGNLAPAFDGIGSKVRPDWLRNYLADPTPVRPGLQVAMPRLFLAPAELDALVAALNAVADPRVSAEVTSASGSTTTEAELGRKLFLTGIGPGSETIGVCAACHRHGGPGGAVGPDLTHAVARLQPEWVYAWLRLGNRLVPATRMPSFNLSDADARRLAAFVLSDLPAAAPGQGGQP
jgi:cbb3-type cytochrome oxidase cytochrome c subunit